MSTHFDLVRKHALHCALTECLTTPELAAYALGCAPESARVALKNAADSGHFRAVLLPGLGNKIAFQPTAKAARIGGPSVPKFLRSGLAPDARWRGLLRGFVRFQERPELSYLPTEEQSALAKSYGIQTLGHARALVGLDGSHTHIYIPVLRSDKPMAAIETASFRWLLLLDAGVATLHFVAHDGPVAEAVKTALAVLAPTGADQELQAELDALEAQIQADKSGMASLKLSARRARLQAEIEAAGPSFGGSYGWLGGLVEVRV